ncbi:MAG: d(CMP) kinase [Pseudomonadota bacterium]
MSFCVAIDGPAAAGKGTIARALSKHFNLAHLDSGLLYRAVGARKLAGQDPIEAARLLDPGELDGESLRRAEIAKAASEVAVIAEVRAALRDFQRAFAHRAGGAVIDGRDIGTVICPEAAVKLFVTASPRTRAERRHAELLQRGEASDLARVEENVIERDRRDSERALSPLVPADDAFRLDTTALSIEEAVAQAITIVSDKRSQLI